MAPGGPMSRMLQESAAKEDGSKSNTGGNSGLSEEAIERMEEEYGIDKSMPHAYAQWLGVLPKETLITKAEFKNEDGMVKDEEKGTETVRIVTKGEGKVIIVVRKDDELVSAKYEDGSSPEEAGWTVKLETPKDRLKRRNERNDTDSQKHKYVHRAVVYKENFAGVLEGRFGYSEKYQDPVMSMIGDKVPISVYFGLLSSIIIYGICIPLGVVKAIKHRTFIDNTSSILIFLGYSIPGFALGGVLLVHLGVNNQIFPLFGLISPEYEHLSFWERMGNWEAIKDVVWHTVLPLACYVVGGFAMMTMMMKNNLMDNLAADYVRTAMAKGVPFRKAVFGHAFRNSMIPIAASLGGLIMIFVGGSMLIEKVFDIDGFGLLQFNAVLTKDMPVIMGTLTISAFLMLLGNILSDVIVAMIDPRIKFN